MKKVLSVVLVFLFTATAVSAVYFSYRHQQHKTVLNQLKTTKEYKALEQKADSIDYHDHTNSEVVVDFKGTNAAVLGIKTIKTNTDKQLSFQYNIVNYYLAIYDNDTITTISPMR